MRTSKAPQQLISLCSHPRCVQTLLLALAATFTICGTQAIAAQSPSATPSPTPTAHHKKAHSSAAHPAVQPGQAVQAASAPVAPPVPEPPHWPANDKPAQATIVWDSQGLRIDAANCSLQQILKEVSTLTGVKVEGLGSDERVFGAYGPGLAREVLSQLLQGSSYNVLMIGDQGQGAPRQLVLTSRNPVGASDAKNPTNSGDDDSADDADEQPQPQSPPPAPSPVPMRPGFGPGGPQRNPQQIHQEQQQRVPPQN